MAIDLANGYQYKDSASASNVYYGYTSVVGAGPNDFVYSIRNVNTAAGIETVSWTNNNPKMYVSSWSGRTYSFTAPLTGLGLTWSLTASGNFRSGTFNWSPIIGVNKYVVTVTNQEGSILNSDGSKVQGPYARTWTVDLTNFYSHQQSFPLSGTYTVTVSANNFAGSTSSTATINFV